MMRRVIPSCRAAILPGLLILCCLVFLPSTAMAVGGILDGFAIYAGGTVEIAGSDVKAIAVQPWDAKIIIGGEFTITGGMPVATWTNLARINHDGTLDTSFQPQVLDGPVRAIAIQPDPDPQLSRIIIGGSFSHIGPETRNGLARLASADGALDATFNPATSLAAVKIYAIALLPDGKAILVGGGFDGIALGATSRNLARITIAGPDPGAGAWTYSDGIDGEVNAIMLQNGSIVIGGNFQAPKPLLARLTGNGGFDPAFPGNFITAAPGGSVNALAPQADGRVLLAGDFEALWGGAPQRTYLARLNRDGSHDAAFNPAPNGSVASLVVRPDGKILAAGEFTGFGAPAVARDRLALVDIHGGVGSSFAVGLDGAAKVIVRQADGNILVGGGFANAGTKPRTRLARFYYHGALDDDLAAAAHGFDSSVSALSVRPDGSINVGGLFNKVQGADRSHIARLNGDANLAPAGEFNPNLSVDLTPNFLAPRGDQSLLIGGNFATVSGAAQKALVAVDAAGNAGATAQLVQFNANIKAFMTTAGASAQAVAVLPKDTFIDGLRLEEGMVYIGGNFNAGSPQRYLARVKADGTIDGGFTPPPQLNSAVMSLALQPDHKVVLGTASGKILRLDAKGNLDLDLTPVALGGAVTSIVIQEDGRVVASGGFGKLTADGLWRRNILRFNTDGSIDETLKVQATYGGIYGHSIQRITLQADGAMLIHGVFHTIKDATGTSYPRETVARIKPGGELDQSFNVGDFTFFTASPVNNLISVILQPDGKMVMGGAFTSLNGGGVGRLLRGSNGWASEELSVSSDGSTVTWLRSGTSPELWGVAFESADDPDAAVWTHLGDAQRVAGGWRLAGQNLAAPAYGVNRYVRARGYSAGERGGGGLLESVRLYYLEPSTTVINVKAVAKEKNYGDADPPLTYTFAPALAAGDSFSGGLTRTAGNDAGSYTVEQGTLALDPGKYILAFESASFTIKPLPVTVTADRKEKRFGDPDPAFTVSAAPPLRAGDAFGGAVVRIAGEDVGEYAINQGTLALGGNYAMTFAAGKLKVNPLPVTVTADRKEKRFGDPDPAFTVSAAPPLRAGDAFGGAVARIAGEDVGEYAINQGTLALGGNYAMTFAAGKLKVSPLSVIVTASPQTKVYGAADPLLTFTTVPAAATGGALTRTPGESVGTYAITQGTLSIGSNYGLTFHGSDLAITRRDATVSAVSSSKTYGAADPACAALAGGFLAADLAPGRITLSAVRDPGESAGSYPLRAAADDHGTALLGNYTVQYLDGTFTVIKAPLRVVAKDISRAYLTPNPGLTATYRGFVSGDGESALSGFPLLATAANQASPVGSYPIVAGLGTLSAVNYSIVPVNGTLSVFKSCQEITFPPIPERTFGDPPFEIVASACSGLTLSFTSSNPAVAQVSGNVVTITGAGSAVITASQPGDGSLETAPQRSQTFVVHKSGQAVSFSSLAQKVVGDPPFELAGTATSGLAVGYLSSEPGVAVVNGNSVAVTGVGTTVISAIQPGDGNFQAALPVSQTLTVAQEWSPPLVSLSTVASGSATANPVLNVMGGASDPSGIESLTVHGTDRTADAALFSSAVPLAAGVNSISIAARDGAGNLTTQTVAVTLDPLAPALSVAAPADNSVTDVPSCTVSGSVPPGSAVAMRVNDDAPQLLQVEGGSYTGTALLAEGVNTIELSAELSGRSSRVKRSVTLAPGAPPLAITDPVQDMRTEEQSITIRGTTTAGLAGGIMLEVDGAAFFPDISSGGFQQQIALNRTGEIRITARGTGSGGQTSVAHRNVLRVERISGDLNGNGSVDIEDAAALLRVSLGLEPATAEALSHGDLAPLVDGAPQPDGVIDVGDLLVLLRKIVGLVQF